MPATDEVLHCAGLCVRNGV